MNRLILCLLGVVFSAQVFGQKEDPVLFSVAGAPVHASEFEYIYNKTNGKNADYTRESLQEYLDLYVKFKLKVKRAKEMKLDTITQLKEELDGYRKQLADSYLINKEVTERLVREAYDRSRQDVEISHILFLVSPEASPADSLAAFRKAQAAKRQLDAGEETFANLAVKISEDKSAPKNNGRVGFLNVPFPNGFYALETAAYTLPLNKVSDPVRTTAGYHLIVVHSRRPARGEIEVAQILIRKDERETMEAAEGMIRALYDRLKAGESFEVICRQSSDDRKTADKGGYLGFFGINRFEAPFEEAAFALAKDGDYSEPVETSVGWHIIKRISYKEPAGYDLARPQLEARIKRDGRFELARKGMIADIKRNNGFKETPATLDRFAQTLSDTFFTFRWKPSGANAKDVLFTLGNQRVTLQDFNAYLGDAARERMRLRETPIPDAVQTLYNAFVEQRCMTFEERQLEQKYPDFRSLIREYEEGILLFEATRIEVWDKAAQDSVGLEQFFQTIRGKYRWNDRAEVTKYVVDALNMNQMEPLRAFVKMNPKESALAKFNTGDKPPIQAETFVIERDKSPEGLDLREWATGEVSSPKVDRNTNQFYFLKVEKVIPATPKELSEARGYIVADYQDFLEQQWVEALRKAYEVKVNQTVLEKLIRK